MLAYWLTLSTCWGYAGNFPNTIQIYEKYWAQGVNQAGDLFQYQAATPVTPQLVVHELGHAFNILGKRQFESYISGYDSGSLLVRPDGFASGYSFGQDNSASEISADMFVGWVYGEWRDDDLGPVRADVMTTNVGTWITEAQNNR